MIIDKVQCIHKLYSNAVSVTRDLDTDVYKAYDLNGSEISIDMTAVNAEFSKQDYQNKRVKEYPRISEQLDQIYHEGIDAWKTTIKAVKDKYPKG